MNTSIAELELETHGEKTAQTVSAEASMPIAKVKPLRRDTQITRAKILDAAEELFAKNSITGTSLLDIAKASEQKNRSALQYHFNNKEGLLDSVLDRHAYPILDQRNAMLDELEARDHYTLKDLMLALIVPMADHLDQPGGANFLRIHSDLMSHEHFKDFREVRYNKLNDMQRLRSMGTTKISEMSEEEKQARRILTGCLLIHGFSTYLATAPQPSRDLFTSTMAQSLADLWSQPANGTDNL
ncbi:MAG: TetR/AcrR family transcriptional regulator [Cellvibrionaceae bacterium]